ncbi:hypothetical protein UY3_04097 [Chelonia mydas]|uniref:Uncharacterized protein n=1 Tax=Chelonia mydas TaxID=8469 RepID=M7C2Z3_CHEMY|nr:hypothetical protein UY3_04097 [Chelonia mydas]
MVCLPAVSAGSADQWELRSAEPVDAAGVPKLGSRLVQGCGLPFLTNGSCGNQWPGPCHFQQLPLAGNGEPQEQRAVGGHTCGCSGHAHNCCELYLVGHAHKCCELHLVGRTQMLRITPGRTRTQTLRIIPDRSRTV